MSSRIVSQDPVAEPAKAVLDAIRLSGTATDSHELLQSVAGHLLSWSGCDAVGVRLRDGDNYPYFEQQGFSADFLQTENQLCQTDDDGVVVRDAGGNALLDCMCGNVLCGRFDPAKPFFTERGSFWSNGTTELLATTTEADRQARTRNRCNGEGYESVLLIALRSAGEVLGLLQLNSRRPGCFTAEMVDLLEQMADGIAGALAERRAKEALHKSEERYRSLFETMLEGFAYCQMVYDDQGAPVDWVYLAVNNSFTALTGLADVVGRKVTELLPGVRQQSPELFEVYGRVASEGVSERFEIDFTPLAKWLDVGVSCPEKGRFVAVFQDITERKLAEEALLVTQFSVDHAADCVLWLKPDGRIRYANESICCRLKYSRQELVGMSIFEIDQGASLDTWSERWSVIKKGGPLRFERSYRGKDGELFPVEITANHFEYEGREYNCAFVRDITERKRADEALRESEENLREAQRLSNVGSWKWTAATDTVQWSEELCRINRYDPQLPVPTFAEMAPFYAPASWERLRGAVKAAVERGEPFELELDQVRADGVMRRTISRGAVDRDADGNIVSLRGAVQDITERHQAAASLRRTQFSLDNAADAVYWTDPAGHLVFVSEAACRLFGYSREELLKMSAMDLDPSLSLEQRAANWERMKKEGTFTVETVVRTKSGDTRPVEVTVNYLAFEETEYNCVFARDISERKRAEEALRTSQQIIEGILNAIPVRVFWKDKNLVYLGCNLVFARDAGFADPKDVIGKSDYEMAWRAQADLYRDDDRQVVESGCPKLLVEEPQTTPGGNTIVLLTSKIPLLDSQGEISGVLGTYLDITQRKRAEEALRRSERELLEAQALAGVGSWTYDPATEQSNWSEGMFRIWGLDPSCGAPDYSSRGRLIHPEDSQRFDDAVRESVEHGTPYEIELRLHRPDGAERTIISICEPQCDATGRVVSLRGTVQDITERKRAEEALRLAAERYESVTHSAMDSFWAADPEGRILEVNEACLAMYGYSRDEMLDLHVADIDVGESQEMVREHQRRILELGEDRFEARHRRKDGTLLDVEVSAMAWGAQGLIGSFARDMTEHRRAEEELRDTNELFAELMRHTPVYTYIKTVTPTASRVVAASDNFQYMVGLASGDMVGKTMEELFPADLAATMTADDWAVVANGQVLEMDETLDGRSYTSIKFPIIQGGRTLLAGYSIDITERKLAQEALREAEEQLRQSQRLEAVGSLAGGIAHDFNNLLTAIIGQTELLRGGVNSLEEQQDGLGEIRAAADRAAALTRQLLAFSRRQALRPRILDVNEVCASMTGLLRRLLGEDIELVFLEEPALWPVEADPGQLEQVIMNLAVNARDAMPDGGKLTIETANVALDREHTAAHLEAQPGPHVRVTVKDTGRGMEEETLSHVFEPFYTTKEPGKGTGLGLSTVYGIVKQSGGSIWASSQPREGSTFNIFFPRAEKPLDWPTAETASPAKVGKSGEATILLVEDEPAVRSLTQRVLGRQGYRVLAAESPDQAIALCDGHTGRIDLVLTDVVLPGMNGRVMVERLLERPGIAPKVLYMSGYTQDVIVHDGRLDEGVAFLEKPFTPDALARRVREVLDYQS